MKKSSSKTLKKTRRKSKKSIQKRYALPKLLRETFNMRRLRNLPKWKKGVIIFFLLSFSALFAWIFWGLPLPSQINDREVVSTKLFDRSGKLLYEIYADKKRTPIKLSDLPPYVWQATIAVEDKDFYKHPGFSITGMTRGIFRTVFQNRVQGGSTLTQQLVKVTLLTPERTLRRKIREAVLSIMIETRYSKDEILEMYLNTIPYGSTAYGVEAASELYLGKQAKDLTLGEAALLAGLPQAPSRYSPFGSNPDAAKGRQQVVLKRMVEDGYISQEQSDEAKNQEIVYSQGAEIKAPHFVLWVKEQLAEKYGDAVVEQGGLRVTTTLDLDLQEYAQEQVLNEVNKLSKLNVGNGAALVTHPQTGEILAMVGSKDYNAQDEDGKVNVLLAKRQPGSSIKPLNYALAIKDERITASTAFADVPTCFSVTGQQSYCPVNYDGGFHGAVQTRFALANSYNIPAVRTLALNGIDNFIDFANDMGITTFQDPSQYGLSLTLGGGEVKPVDMAVAFGVFANGGIKKPLISVLKVEDWKGKTLEKANLESDGDRIIPSGVAFITSHILLDNGARSAAFGTGSFLNVSGHPEVSVKTGTTNDRRDNWTIGYTSQILALAWVGNNDNSSMSGAVSGVSGASPIWNRIIKYALDKAEKSTYSQDDEGHAWPRQPSDVVGANICTTTGTLPQNGWEGCGTRYEYFLKDTVPTFAKGGKQDIQVDKTTGALAGSSTPPENIETRNQTIFYDLLDTAVCLDCSSIASHSAVIRYPLSQKQFTNTAN